MAVVSDLDTLSAARMHGFLNLSRTGSGSNAGHVPTEAAMSEENILSLLIVLGSSVSLVGLVFAFITYSLFSDLRNLSGTTLMNLLASLFMSQLLYVIGVGGVPDSKLCVALAFSLQYIRLSVLCWMLCMTRHMYQQFRNNVNLRPAIENSICRDFFRYSVFSWGVPSILLGASMIIHYHNKAGKLWETTSLMEHNCWFLDTSAYVYGLLVPSAILFLTTITYLVRAGVVAKYIISMQVDKHARHKMQRKRTMQIVLFSKLSILVAGVITLSAFAKLHKTSSTWIAFNAGQSLQGMLVSMIVTCNCHVLKIYTRSIKSRSTRLITTTTATSCPGQGLSRGNSEISKTTSLQMLTWDPVPEGV